MPPRWQFSHHTTDDMTFHCNICGSNVKVLGISPQVHGHARGNLDERACGQCWEAWLSLQIEEKQLTDIQCMFCNSNMSFEEIKKLARAKTCER